MQVHMRSLWKWHLLILMTTSVFANFLSIYHLQITSLAAPASKQNSATEAETVRPDKITQAILNLKESQQRWIEINLKEQKLLAWEGNQFVYGTTISTGKRLTPTPTGVFAVQTKLRQARMRGSDYDIPDVPYTMYYDGNYAIHGAYWHNNFGTPVSHGCVNLPPKNALWLFNWAKVGTPVVVRK
ncbi:L,D-transpeptidase [Calothrix sp. UHCC 0171]|uniref:L,D-transpeptidase n=1 Tax=Calothrix sp. UHCC 0171 TaxID=3110245 RepID=UPI002B1ED7BF|nr:L,D-transpeptidase [Calothrix sp. UHCC 0171]MEA5574673.1 L,D-transpeptidase [Calothrix sp. UHCC 0171]